MVSNVVWLRRFEDLAALGAEQARLNRLTIDWLDALVLADLEADITYASMGGKVRTRPYAGLISHLFLHQVHQRGWATTLLSQSGVDFGDPT